MNRIAVVETLDTPALIYSLISAGLKPTAKPTKIGSRINTTAGVLLPQSRRATIRIIRAKPATPNNDITLLPFTDYKRDLRPSKTAVCFDGSIIAALSINV